MEMKLNQPVSNPSLMSALHAVRDNRTDEADNRLIRELHQAQYLVPAHVDGEIEENQLKQGGQIRFILISSPDGQDFFPAFTDWSAVDLWAEKSGLAERPNAVALSYGDIRELLQSAQKVGGFVVNPFRDGLILTRQQMEYFDSHTASVEEQAAGKSTQITVGAPKEYPRQLVDAVSRVFRKHAEIGRAWLFLAKREDEEHSNYLVIAEFTGDDGRRKELFAEAAQAALPYLNGKFLDFLSYGEEFSRDACSHADPFYEKTDLSNE